MELLPLVQSPSPDLEAFLAEHEFGKLPEGETAWEVKPPQVVVPPRPLARQTGRHLSGKTYFVGCQCSHSLQSLHVLFSGDSHDMQVQQAVLQGDTSGLKAWPPNSNTAGFVEGMCASLRPVWIHTQ